VITSSPALAFASWTSFRSVPSEPSSSVLVTVNVPASAAGANSTAAPSDAPALTAIRERRRRHRSRSIRRSFALWIDLGDISSFLFSDPTPASGTGSRRQTKRGGAVGAAPRKLKLCARV
jgi:hypothetical protein